MSTSQSPSPSHVNVSRRLALVGTGAAAAALVVAGARSALADESEALELDVSALGFLYLDSPKLVLGQIQHVAVSLADLGVTEEAELSVAAPDGSTLAVAPASLTASSYLFSFVPDALGAHTVLGLVFVATDGVRRSLDLASCAGDASLFDVVAESAQDEATDAGDAADAVDEFSTTEAYALDDADELVSADTVEECIEEHVDAEEVASSLDEASDEAASATEASAARAAAGTATLRTAVRTTGAAATTRVAADSSSSSSLVVALDPGHGGTDSGTYFTYDGTTVYERDLTWAIANACMDELSSYSGLSLVLTRDEDEYVSISDRVTRAAEAGASLIVSFHVNSTSNTTSTTANGAEVFVPYDGTYNNETHEIGATLAEYILEELTELGLNSRGLKYKIIEDDDSYNYADGSCGDYYGILRYARQLAITGILIEHAFLNNASDYEDYLSTDEKLVALGQADARGIVAGLQSLGLLDGSTSTSTSEGYVTIYRLYNSHTGEHLYTRSTTERTKCLKAGWVDENIGWYAPTSGTEVRRLYNPHSGDHLYSTSSTEPAKLVALGWQDEGVNLYSAEGGDGTVEVYRLFNPHATVGTHLFTTSSTEVTKCVAAGWTYEGVVIYGIDITELTPIMGTTTVTSSQMVSHYAQAVGEDAYPADVYEQYGAASIDAFCAILVEEAEVEGVRAEVLYAQVALETGYLQFGGDVQAEQCNFGGLGATGGGEAGCSFNTYGTSSVRMGLRAQVQHLKAYASTDDLVNECVDPRFSYVTRGCAPYVENLGNGNWASSSTYATSLLAIMSALEAC